ncbi:helix-turn-helix domain-containing protein, partial [Arcticibacter tournemirensis]
MATVVRVFYSTYAILLEIAYRVWKVRHKCGFSIGDMAFLMNTPLSFLKKIENPTLNVPPSSLKTNA